MTQSINLHRHLAQDMSDSVFTETEMAQSYREIAQRDPAFDMPAFLRQVRLGTKQRNLYFGLLAIILCPIADRIWASGMYPSTLRLRIRTAAAQRHTAGFACLLINETKLWWCYISTDSLFLRQVKADVPVVVRAYLQGEIDILKVG